jgi:hypothetical protein
MCQTYSLELRFLWEKDDDQTWLLYKFYMLRVYNLITIKKTNCYCKKTCESKINLKIIIFYTHMAMLGFLRPQYHHAKAKEPHFTFLHIKIIYKPFKTIYQASSKLNQ